MQDKKQPIKKDFNPVQVIKRKQTKLAIIVLATVVLFVAAIFILISSLDIFGSKTDNNDTKSYHAEELPQYISENWPEYVFDSYDSTTHIITLHGELEYSFDTAQKYGAAVFDENYFDAYISVVQQIAIGISVDCDIDNCTVILNQLATDKQIIYSVTSNGEKSACWE